MFVEELKILYLMARCVERYVGWRDLCFQLSQAVMGRQSDSGPPDRMIVVPRFNGLLKNYCAWPTSVNIRLSMLIYHP